MGVRYCSFISSARWFVIRRSLTLYFRFLAIAEVPVLPTNQSMRRGGTSLAKLFEFPCQCAAQAQVHKPKTHMITNPHASLFLPSFFFPLTLQSTYCTYTVHTVYCILYTYLQASLPDGPLRHSLFANQLAQRWELVTVS